MEKSSVRCFSSVAIVTFALGRPVLADGAGVFNANCAACHANGGNVVNPAKTIKQKDLDANGKNTLAAVVAQVTNGNGAMPAFGASLSSADIESVAQYVLDQAPNGNHQIRLSFVNKKPLQN
ncbi:MAG: c-type cytochrome [Acaryochloridaceae cyanobacterium CSU_5_19]|nr:c-type cytochrome [Acaryochloridaceae cyanobacterium CSU_5_19]